MNTKFFLPGTDQQQKILLSNIDVKGFTILVIGSGSEEIAERFISENASKITLITDDDNSLFKARLQLSNVREINIKLMEFDNTDFANSYFDLIYAQASISNKKRAKIINEVKRILKPGGYFCVGENVSLTKSPPQFVDDVWKSSNIFPLFADELKKYYEEKGFKVIHEHDLSKTLTDFYTQSSILLKEKADILSDQEKSFYKKMLKQISHESNVYLKLGGNAHIGFKTLILKKGLS